MPSAWRRAWRRSAAATPTAANKVGGAQDTLALTRPALLAWLERRLRPNAPGGEAAQLEFAGWLRAQHAAGAVSFEFKGPLHAALGAEAGGGEVGNIVSMPAQRGRGEREVPGQAEAAVR